MMATALNPFAASTALFRWLFSTAMLIVMCSCEVLITNQNYSLTLAHFNSMSASFGISLPNDGLHGAAIAAKPSRYGCLRLDPPPAEPKNMSWIAVIARSGGCSFADKVKIATKANYSAAIIYNLESDKVNLLEAGLNNETGDLVMRMGGPDADDLIPSVFIGYTNGQMILKHYTFNTTYRVILFDDEPFDINAYLLPFAIVVGICFVIMLAIVIYKCIQDHRRRMRHRLPKSALKKLPIHKFKNGDPFETCCICLDDFEEGDKLRILPCDHGYHSKCIDSWLVKHKRICPQCRKRVFDRGTGYSSDSDNVETPNERAPLLGPPRASAGPSTSSGASGGTFSASAGPSTSGVMNRLREPSSSSQPDSYLTTNEYRRLFTNRRLRRPRRLRRLYEVLSESTTSSDNDEEANEDQEPTFDTQLADDHSIADESHDTEVSAEIHSVQVYPGASNDDDDEESLVAVERAQQEEGAAAGTEAAAAAEEATMPNVAIAGSSSTSPGGGGGGPASPRNSPENA